MSDDLRAEAIRMKEEFHSSAEPLLQFLTKANAKGWQINFNVSTDQATGKVSVSSLKVMKDFSDG